MRLQRSEYVLYACAVSLVLLTAVGLAIPQPVIGRFGIGYGVQLDQFVAAACLQALIYFVAAAVILHGNPPARAIWLILGTAALMRIMVLVFPPFLSNDMYRYIWDGWVQAAGINPYRYIPADPHLAFLRDAAVYPNINRANYAHTIYPPAAEMFFTLTTRISGLLSLPPVLAMKLAMTGAEAVAIWAMLHLLDAAGLPRRRVLIYAWCPLPVWEFAGNGHVDAIAICFIALALLAAASRKRYWAAAALATASLAKFLPAVLLPVVWRRWDWRFAALFTGLILLFYAPYLAVGAKVLGFLGGYSAQEGIDSGHGIFLLSVLGLAVDLPYYASTLYLLVLALVLLALGAIIVFRHSPGAEQPHGAQALCGKALWLGCVLMVGLSPHYPWYYCWLLIPACILPSAGTIYLVTASLLLYLNPVHTELFFPAFVYGPFFVLALCQMWLGRSATKRHLAPSEGVEI